MQLPPDPGLTVALALLAGMACQSAAARLRIPAIVPLLATGAVLGPSLLGWVQPSSLGVALHAIVGFAVSVVLFEGGLRLDLRRLRRQQRPIRLLITLGAAVTATGATLTARWLLGWDWQLAVLFGALVVVTGPTVVTPILQRVRVDSRVATVLEAEAVLGDAVGAVLAVAAYELASANIDGGSIVRAALELLMRLGVGASLGAMAGLALVWLLRSERLVPRGLENVFALAFVLAMSKLSDTILHESGIVAAVAAGMVVGNMATRVSRELREFKEELAALFIGLLFVLLAADIVWSEVVDLGWPALTAVFVLMFVVRPIAVFCSTMGSKLPLRHRLFVSWLAPRGIIAASVASLFSVGLHGTQLEGSSSFREMIFLVIIVTVGVAGTTGGIVARLLKVRRSDGAGWVLLGAGPLARTLAKELQQHGHEALCIDSQPDAIRAAEEANLRVLYGNGLEELTLRRAEVDRRTGFVALTSNEVVNLMFAQIVKRLNKSAPIYVTLDTKSTGITQQMVQDSGAEVFFGASHGTARWDRLFERGEAVVERWRASRTSQWDSETGDQVGLRNADVNRDLLPLLVERDGHIAPVGDDTTISSGDVATLALVKATLSTTADRLRSMGWTRVDGARTSTTPVRVDAGA